MYKCRQMARKVKKNQNNMKPKIFLECYMCRKRFTSTVGNLRRHINSHGSTLKKVKCLKCGKSFQSKGNYHVHWKIQHSQINLMPEHPCTFPRKFKCEYSLKNHKFILFCPVALHFFLEERCNSIGSFCKCIKRNERP